MKTMKDLLDSTVEKWKYMAMDKRGAWYAYTDKPYPGDDIWVTHEGDMVLIGYQEKLEDLFGIQPCWENWDSTLIER